MTSQLRRLVYISTAGGLSSAEVDRVIAASVENNPGRGVTGLLLYNGRNFLQMIEGEKAALFGLMAVVARDSRHAGIVTLQNVDIAARSCPDWQMTHIRLADDVRERELTIAGQLPPGLDSETRRLIANFAILN